MEKVSLGISSRVSGNAARALAQGFWSGWDVDSRDWSSDATVNDIVSNVLSNSHPGAIVLMHDGGLGGGNPDRTRTIEALPRIIDGLHAAGYAVVTIPDATGLPLQQSGSTAEDLRC